MDDGTGLANMIPAFDSANFVHDRDQLVCMIIKGSKDSINLKYMPHFMMTEVQISNLLNYISHLRSIDCTPFNDSEVKSLLNRCK